MDEDFDFGFSTVDNSESLKIKVESTAKEYIELNKRTEEILRLINIFLDNLAKDPEKDIHWPNRDIKIKQFKTTLDDIYKGK